MSELIKGNGESNKMHYVSNFFGPSSHNLTEVKTGGNGKRAQMDETIPFQPLHCDQIGRSFGTPSPLTLKQEYSFNFPPKEVLQRKEIKNSVVTPSSIAPLKMIPSSASLHEMQITLSEDHTQSACKEYIDPALLLFDDSMVNERFPFDAESDGEHELFQVKYKSTSPKRKRDSGQEASFSSYSRQELMHCAFQSEEDDEERDAPPTKRNYYTNQNTMSKDQRDLHTAFSLECSIASFDNDANEKPTELSLTNKKEVSNSEEIDICYDSTNHLLDPRINDATHDLSSSNTPSWDIIISKGEESLVTSEKKNGHISMTKNSLLYGTGHDLDNSLCQSFSFNEQDIDPLASDVLDKIEPETIPTVSALPPNNIIPPEQANRGYICGRYSQDSSRPPPSNATWISNTVSNATNLSSTAGGGSFSSDSSVSAPHNVPPFTTSSIRHQPNHAGLGRGHFTPMSLPPHMPHPFTATRYDYQHGQHYSHPAATGHSPGMYQMPRSYLPIFYPPRSGTAGPPMIRSAPLPVHMKTYSQQGKNKTEGDGSTKKATIATTTSEGSSSKSEKSATTSSWTNKDDGKLQNILKSYTNPRFPKDWEAIAKKLGNGRTAKECRDQWDLFVKPGNRKVQWREDEDEIITEAVTSCGKKAFTKWSDLARKLPGRIGKQVRDRWVNHLNPNIDHGPFTREDDMKLWKGQKQLGKKWVDISTKFFNSTRSENKLKNRWYGASFKKFVCSEFGEDAMPEEFRKDIMKKSSKKVMKKQ